MRLFMMIFICCSATQLAGQPSQENFIRFDREGKVLLTDEGASHFAKLALNCIQREYPNKLSQVLSSKKSLAEPHELHPAFHGCFDWHSSVHGHWMLVRLLREYPHLSEAPDIRAKLNKNLTKRNLNKEVEYFKNASKSFERMYGWSWLMKLAHELEDWKDSDAKKWRKALEPLVKIVIQRYEAFLPIQQYPVRTGVHPNTAFGLSFALDYANAVKNNSLISAIEKTSINYYADDRDCPASWEPSGEDFLSPCLVEADLMQRIYNKSRFNRWWKKFVKGDELQSLMTPADVSDRSDPKIVHLDGLNLCRAWCMYRIASSLKKKKDKEKLRQAAKAHLTATLPHIASSHYEGSHWLASFAVYALSSEN